MKNFVTSKPKELGAAIAAVLLLKYASIAVKDCRP
jgi:hypothetical protein